MWEWSSWLIIILQNDLFMTLSIHKDRTIILLMFHQGTHHEKVYVYSSAVEFGQCQEIWTGVEQLKGKKISTLQKNDAEQLWTIRDSWDSDSVAS